MILKRVEQAFVPLCAHRPALYVGFGIRSQTHAASVARLADGVVVGSALVDRIAKAAGKEQAVGDVLGMCRELAEG